MYLGPLLSGILAYWVLVDAKSRRMNGPLWAIFVFLLFIIAIPVYLIARKPRLAD